MNHMISLEIATKLLALKGYTVRREAMAMTVHDKDGKEVARALLDWDELVARHALKHLLDDNKGQEHASED